MKRFFAFAAVVAAAMSVVSCGMYSYVETVDHRETSERILPFTNSYVMTTPFVADLELVDSKIVEKEIEFDRDVTRYLIDHLEVYKSIALTEALQKLREEDKMEVDALLGVLFDVKTDFKHGKTQPGKLVITVRGYPAKYINFRKATVEDVNLIYTASHSQRNEDVLIPNAPQKGAVQVNESVQYVR